MTLLLRPEEHAGLVSFAEAIEVIEHAYRALAKDPCLDLLRQIANEKIRLSIHMASNPLLNAAGLMAHSRSRSPNHRHAASGLRRGSTSHRSWEAIPRATGRGGP